MLFGREFIQRIETKKAKDSNPKCEIDIQVLDYVPNTAREHRVDAALSNSFGFGGTNASLVLKRVER